MEETNMVENIFEYAVENKLRFPYKGSVSVEDLYALTTVELDSIYKTLRREVKKANEESLLETKSDDDVVLSVKIDIIKRIVSKKLAQIEARNKAARNKEEKNKLLAIIAQKQEADLHNKSIEELTQMVANLD
jgi:hypothetical protein